MEELGQNDSEIRGRSIYLRVLPIWKRVIPRRGEPAESFISALSKFPDVTRPRGRLNLQKSKGSG